MTSTFPGSISLLIPILHRIFITQLASSTFFSNLLPSVFHNLALLLIIHFSAINFYRMPTAGKDIIAR